MKKPVWNFTLIELLVVIAMVAILAGLLMPSLNKARAKARITQCISNLKQIGTGCDMYRDDYNNAMPPWISPLYKNYLSDKKIYRCKSDTNPESTAPEKWRSRSFDDEYENSYDRLGNHGKYGNDPNPEGIPVSYFYEFSEAPCQFGSALEQSTLSWNQKKMKDIRSEVCNEEGQFKGKRYKSILSMFPVVRCSWHLTKANDKPVVNVSYEGNAFFSVLKWEEESWAL